MNPGRALIIAGLLMAAVGVLLVLGERLPWRPGQLPGDITIQGKNSTFYFPVVTCVVISVALSLVMWLFSGRR